MKTMKTMTHLDADDVRSLDIEISRCRDIQAWTHGSTRSAWVSELVDIRDAINSKGNVPTRLIAKADRMAHDLAMKVADALAEDAETIATLKPNHCGDARDGYVCRKDGVILAYATLRDWRSDRDSSSMAESIVALDTMRVAFAMLAAEFD
jgi:hypothetical protein